MHCLPTHLWLNSRRSIVCCTALSWTVEYRPPRLPRRTPVERSPSIASPRPASGNRLQRTPSNKQSSWSHCQCGLAMLCPYTDSNLVDDCLILSSMSIAIRCYIVWCRRQGCRYIDNMAITVYDFGDDYVGWVIMERLICIEDNQFDAREYARRSW